MFIEAWVGAIVHTMYQSFIQVKQNCSFLVAVGYFTLVAGGLFSYFGKMRGGIFSAFVHPLVFVVEASMAGCPVDQVIFS